jgi:hypothetical protein
LRERCRRIPAKISPHIRKRQEHLPKDVQDIAWKAQVRLCNRYRRLICRGKNPNVAVTAIARELAAFMWAISREVRLGDILKPLQQIIRMVKPEREPYFLRLIRELESEKLIEKADSIEAQILMVLVGLE